MDKEKIKKIYAGLCLAWELDQNIEVSTGDYSEPTYTIGENHYVIEELQEIVGKELTPEEREYIEKNYKEIFGEY